MKPIFTKNYTVRDCDVDCFGRLKPSVLLYFAQDVAGSHCDLLSLNYDELAQKRLFWAVIRHRVQISRWPQRGETVTVETWPMPTTRVAYPRAFAMYDSEGNLLAQAISLWVLMDMNTRAMVLPGKSGVVVNGTLRGCELDVPKSILPKELPESQYRTVTYSLLDINGHMNNTRYLDWLDDLLSAEYHASHTLQEFTICYLSEAREGQNICLHHSLSENILQVDARRERTDVDGKVDRVFSAQVQFS